MKHRKRAKQNQRRIKKRKANERERQKRLQRRERNLPSLPASERFRRVWATSKLALAVSGRMSVVFEMETAENATIVFTHGSLLAGGYLGSLAANTEGGKLSDIKDDGSPFGDKPTSWTEASALAWGFFCYSSFLGTIDPDEFDGPAMGILSQPAGKPDAWVRKLLNRFDPALIALAKEVASAPNELADPPSKRPDLPVVVSFRCAVERPLSLRTELDRNSREFVYDRRSGAFEWRRPKNEESKLPEQRYSAGWLWEEHGILNAETPSAECAGALATRLEELATGSLELVTASWTPEQTVEKVRLVEPVRAFSRLR